jgi:polyphosphate kinase 2 (PPK2 family)
VCCVVLCVTGGISGSDRSRPDPLVKSFPASAPYPRRARNRHYHLYWLTQFRHWWKSSRLLVRLAGLAVYANMDENRFGIMGLNLLKKKGPKHAAKFVKRMGQGGPMREFLKAVQPFTRTVRIVCALWRWVEATKARRVEVGVTELMAFLGNRCSRVFARDFMDFMTRSVVLPGIVLLIEMGVLEKREWYSSYILPAMGVLRALAPFAASFQGSRAGRALTRLTFHAAGDKWMTSMRINDVNLLSDDCCEHDEISAADKNADVVEVAKLLAKTLAAASRGATDVCTTSSTIVEGMAKHSFVMVGQGSGGYAKYFYGVDDINLMIHATPYGPSIFDELPIYVVLERSDSQDTRGLWSSNLSRFLYGSPVVEGYCYKGAFFSKYQFAIMKKKYDQQLECYQNACRLMCSAKQKSGESPIPPTDLISLKQFLAMGKKSKSIKRSKADEKELKKLELKLTDIIKAKMAEVCAHRGAVTHDDVEAGGNGLKTGGIQTMAPPRIIFYFEGLDCVGKSSTGRLVLAALESAGYEVSLKQYNRPATAEQRAKPWMDRFDTPFYADAKPGDLGYQSPEDRVKDDSEAKDANFKALVWDRGPAGDFVYGNLTEASEETKHERYQEFLEFDEKCMDQNILFCKLLFIADRDSIAKTLGKRLAHSQICKDLRNWLDSSVGRQIDREGLDEIEHHIDPSDFVAFNSYHKNLHAFTNFARNTDLRPSSKLTNPWLVINTSDRHPARVELLTMFSRELERYSAVRSGNNGFTLAHNIAVALGCSTGAPSMVSFKKHLNFRLRTLLLIMFMLVVASFYVSTKIEE